MVSTVRVRDRRMLQPSRTGHFRASGWGRNAHQLRAIMPPATQTYVSLAAPPEGAARAELRALPGRRLHARVRPRCPPARHASRLPKMCDDAPGALTRSAGYLKDVHVEPPRVVKEDVAELLIYPPPDSRVL
jgi:hypothetical protein